MIERLREIEPSALTTFTDDLKKDLVNRVTDKVSHLESSLAVAELTVVLHYLMNTPEDVLIWDVGHQGYVHKALTGRLIDLQTQRHKNGISGFLRRAESLYDFFGAGHASTSISALTGVCLADQSTGLNRKRVAVIGDGSMTGGQSFEALNHLSTIDTDALVILNDNNGSIDPTIGSLHIQGNYKHYFQSLGWRYTYVNQGNNIASLLEAVKAAFEKGGKQVLHIQTYRPLLSKTKSYKPATTFQWWAAEKLRSILSKDAGLRILSPAMFAGSGFAPLRKEFPKQFIDSGINEPHTVTTAAGIVAAGGYAWVHIYSTFLQRAVDQVIHDVALQGLPLIFLVDRAGIVGGDGPTHHGVFDLGFLMDIPNVTIWNSRNGDELQAMISKAWEIQGELSGPLFIRYPKDKTSCDSPEEFSPYHWLTEQNSNSLLVSTGHLTSKVQTGLFDHLHLGQIKPLPPNLTDILSKYSNVLVLEESLGQGGLFGAIAGVVADADLNLRLAKRKISDAFTNHGVREELLKELGLMP
ncbi:1-deoxy-D-xylulose-5-phosphate synthase N-terminal domain-containing protein [Schleiferiaceae bacterium]|nr:hypothetical protein [Flavobacteriales bacterium]MDC1021798.1 1-deoxy-D-xylulose-5-phosphate synthase N-terminal domain-containing protein [Schleiferiaceae bacterium]|tara:strand:+ start:12775 stop:14349 length:1575 start_codon:yes stop_codon:yes gene_type:complete